MNHSIVVPTNDDVHGARPEWNTNSEGFVIGGLVDLNRVVQHAFEEQQQRIAALRAIVRCDRLPLVPTGGQACLLLFGHLLDLILEHAPRNSKLFIYLKCDRRASDAVALTLPEGFVPHDISFYTNSNMAPEWEKGNSATLATCQQLALQSHGTLGWQTAPGAGCLFTLTLPGKIN